MLGLKQIEEIAIKQQNKPALITDDFSFGWTDYKLLVEGNCSYPSIWYINF